MNRVSFNTKTAK